MKTAEILAFFEKHNIRDVECIIPDVSGYPRGKLMPAASFAKGAELRLPEIISMQCINGDYSLDPVFPPNDSDMRMTPDMATLKLSPWSKVPRAVAIHDMVHMNGEPSQLAPRSVLKRVLQNFEKQGLTPVVAPEIEFYLTAPCDDPNQPFSSPNVKNGRTEVGQSAYSINSMVDHSEFWEELRSALETLGVRADSWIHEMGTSQYEINLLHGDPVEVADQAFLFKYATREIAAKHGLNAVFMAKPIQGEYGSSMHLHQSVVDAKGRNIFARKNGDDSSEFLSYIAGLQKYVPVMLPVFAPFVNSFRRFGIGTQAPVNLSWGRDNRSAGLRIPLGDAAARRVENRLAGADANPYLIIAASLAAGLAGMNEKLRPTKALGDNEDAYLQSQSLDRFLDVALQRMRNSADAKRLLGDKFVDGYTSVKELEYSSFFAEISPWERRFLGPQA